MEDQLGNEIGRLRESTERNRCQFLHAELDACRTALELANLGLMRGNSPAAEKEIVFIERSLCTIDRFLPGVSLAERPALDSGLDDLKAALTRLREAVRSQCAPLSKTA